MSPGTSTKRTHIRLPRSDSRRANRRVGARSALHQAVGGLEEADLQQRFPPLTVIPPCAVVTKAAYLAIS